MKTFQVQNMWYGALNCCSAMVSLVLYTLALILTLKILFKSWLQVMFVRSLPGHKIT
jgi:hypothetical protein